MPTSTSGLGSARDQTQGFVHARQHYQLSHSHSPRPAFPVSQEITRYLTLPLLLSFTLHTPHSQGTLRGLHLPVFPGFGCSPEECQDVKSNPMTENVSDQHCLPPSSHSKPTTSSSLEPEPISRMLSISQLYTNLS